MVKVMSEYDQDNIFAKVIRGEMHADIIYEDDNVIAFKDIYPVAAIHILVIPKKEYISFDDFICSASEEYVSVFFKTVREIALSLNLVEVGYRLVTNHGKLAHQTVKHFHVHILSGNNLKNL